MNNKIKFVPLGGAQSVGASCYYLKIGKSNIILDAGITFSKNQKKNSILDYIDKNISHIDYIYISHAHMDHIGYLFELANHKKCLDAKIFMTDITYTLLKYQMYENKAFKNEKEKRDAKAVLDRISKVSYSESYNEEDFEVSFLSAGHIPGAMMTLFKSDYGNVLYTGDYSIPRTSLVDVCAIPKNKGIDTIIMCGLHAKHPDYNINKDSVFDTINEVYKEISEGNSVKCKVSQLSKGIEFIKLLDSKNISGTPIYIDKSIMSIVEKFENLSIPIINKNIRNGASVFSKEAHIYVTNDAYSEIKNAECKYKEFDIDFSLHADFKEMENFLRKVKPSYVYFVHCAKPMSNDDYTIEDIFRGTELNDVKFVFAEEEEEYSLGIDKGFKGISYSKDEKVGEIIGRIHKSIASQYKRNRKPNDEIIEEGRLISIMCSDKYSGLKRYTEAMKEKHGYNKGHREILNVLRRMNLGKDYEKRVLNWAEEAAEYFRGALYGSKDDFKNFEEMRNDKKLRNIKHSDDNDAVKIKENRIQNKILISMIYERIPEIVISDDINKLHALKLAFSKRHLKNMSDILADVYDFPRDGDEDDDNDNLIEDLQDDFEEQLKNEIAGLLSNMNSEKYGCLLDEFLKEGLRIYELEKMNYEFPPEMSNFVIMVRNMIQFLIDNKIDPLKRIGAKEDIKISDADMYEYPEAGLFESGKETETVEIISPGWIYRDKEGDKNIQISRPKVMGVK